MILIYYTGKDGKIVSHHKANEKMTPEQIGDAVREFNHCNKNGRTAHIFDAPDDGLTAYLHQKALERKRLDKEALQDAISSIKDALDTVRGLEW